MNAITKGLGVPVIAAGGIAERRGVAAALTLGAQGVSVGTAFLISQESSAKEIYKQAVLKAKSHDSVVTRVFSGRPARGIRNRFIDEMKLSENSVAPYPLTHVLTSQLREAATAKNRVEFMSLWAGQSLRLYRSTSAQDIFNELSEGLPIGGL